MASLDDKLKQLLSDQGLDGADVPKPKKQKPKPVVKRVATRPNKAAERAEMFAHAYVRHGCNATAAYKELRPNSKNTTAQVEGSKYLCKPIVQRIIEPLLAGLMEKNGVDTEWAIARLMDQANGSALDYFKEVRGELTFVGMDALTDVQRRNVKAVKITNNQWGQSVSLTVNDQQKAVELLGRYLQMFTKELDPEDESRIGDLIEAGVKRIRENKDLNAWKLGAYEGTFSEVKD